MCIVQITKKNVFFHSVPETTINICCEALHIVYHTDHLSVELLISNRDKKPIAPYPPALQWLFLSELAAVGGTWVKRVRLPWASVAAFVCDDESNCRDWTVKRRAVHTVCDALTNPAQDIKQCDDNCDLEAWLQPSEASSPPWSKNLLTIPLKLWF